MFELQNKKNSQTHCFDQPRLIIGEGGDFAPADEHLLAQHLVIEWNNVFYVIENKAHDPHSLLNGKPFWKKKLQNGDLIKIGRTELSFQQLSSCSSLSLEECETSDSLVHTADELLKQESIPQTHHKQEQHSLPLLKSVPDSGYWHLFVLAFSCIFLFVVLFSTTFYISINERAQIERLYAARGLADISMILSHVQLHSVEPPFKNWLDPDFLKEIGEKIIPKELSKYEWVDSEGHFLEASYILRLYSDAEFTRFLLIAQPIASNFQSLLPKATLVLDSENMVIKEFWKVRDLNRLLVSTSGFEGIIKTEIGEMIEKAASIPLDALAREKERLGFRTPDELAMINPEAIYPIYNAPRYYLAHEAIVDIADKVARNPNDVNLKNALDQALKRIDQHGQVLYTTKGIEAVIGARKVFSRKSMFPNMLLGYLQLSGDGKIEESHLLMPNQNSWSIGAYHHESLIKEELQQVAKEEKSHNLYEELRMLLLKREDDLKTHSAALINLIQDHLQNPDLLFFSHFNTYFDAFKEASKDAQNELDQSLKNLFEKYVLNEKLLQLSEFLAILDEHQIDLGLNQDPEIFDKFYDASIAFEAHLNHLFEMIEEADGLDHLDSLVLVANDLLNKKYPENDPNRLSWKKYLKMLCIRKLETILWQPTNEEESPKEAQDLQWKIARILKNGYINDSEGRNFYLSHFLEEVD